MGAWALLNLRLGGFAGAIYPVNPRYESVAELPCYASLGALPDVPELVIFAVSDARVEAAIDEAIALSVPAAVIHSTLYLDDDDEPRLRERIVAKLENTEMLVCGANGMGFYNVRDHVWACGFDSAPHAAPGNVSLISHSGAGMSGVIDCEQRLRINLAVSTGNELSVTMAEYLDFALDLPETRVVGLFVETARDPQAFEAALRKAASRRIPVVALKTGRTECSAQLTVSHSGALAGDDATYAALFDKYGVQRVRDQDEFTTLLIMFAELHPVGAGGLVTLHDSGGERQLLVDLAADAGVPLTLLANETIAALRKVLDPELPAINPLDGWSRGGPHAAATMTQCLTIMMRDRGAALAAVVHDRAPGSKIYPSYIDYMQRAKADSGKAVALVAATAGSGSDDVAVTTTHAGFPVLDGVAPFLRGVRALFDYRDFLLRRTVRPATPSVRVVEHWKARLCNGEALQEYEGLRLLSDFGLRVAQPIVANNEQAVLRAAAELGYPIVLKTAKAGVLHKSDRGGVIVGIDDDVQLARMYQLMRKRLGDEVLVAPMVQSGVEMMLGVKRDAQFGPVVILGFGGIHAETLQDVQFALPPFDALHARRCFDKLKLRALLDGVRGAPAADVAAVCEQASRFSAMVHALADVLEEVDVNPLIVTDNGATAVDALFCGREYNNAEA